MFSEIQGIDLLVDLNLSACRKKRRKFIREILSQEVENHNQALNLSNRFQALQHSDGTVSICDSWSSSDESAEVEATITTGINLEVSLLSQDEIILKQMIEAEFNTYNQMTERWRKLC